MGLFVFVTCLCAELKLRLSNAGVLHQKSVLHKKEKLESLYFLKKGCLFFSPVNSLNEIYIDIYRSSSALPVNVLLHWVTNV